MKLSIVVCGIRRYTWPYSENMWKKTLRKFWERSPNAFLPSKSLVHAQWDWDRPINQATVTTWYRTRGTHSSPALQYVHVHKHDILNELLSVKDYHYKGSQLRRSIVLHSNYIVSKRDQFFYSGEFQVTPLSFRFSIDELSEDSGIDWCGLFDLAKLALFSNQNENRNKTPSEKNTRAYLVSVQCKCALSRHKRRIWNS